MVKEMKAGKELLKKINDEQFGFLDEAQIDCLANDPAFRLTVLLVRCGSCRFVAPAQDVKHLIGIIEKEGSDYVRDVSIPTD